MDTGCPGVLKTGRKSNPDCACVKLRGRVIAPKGVPMTKARVLRSRVRSKDSCTVLCATRRVTVMLERQRNVSRDRGDPRRPGGQLGGRGTRRKNSFEARGDKRQRAEPHPDPEAAGLSPVWLREEAPFNASKA
jgi:hypothetical protein